MENPYMRMSALCICLMSILLFLWQDGRMHPDGKAHAHFLRAGNSDIALLRSPSGKLILIDTGSTAETLEHLGRLLRFMERRIDLLVITYPEADRLGSAVDILDRYDVRAVLIGSDGQANAVVRRFAATLKQKKTRLISPDMRTVDLGDGLVMEILWPTEFIRGESRQTSAHERLVVRVRHGSGSLLIAGDMRLTQAKEMLAAGVDLRADALQLSQLRVSEDFLRAVSPKLAVINTPVTAHSTVVAPFLSVGIPLKSTANGEVTVTF